MHHIQRNPLGMQIKIDFLVLSVLYFPFNPIYPFVLHSHCHIVSHYQRVYHHSLTIFLTIITINHHSSPLNHGFSYGFLDHSPAFTTSPGAGAWYSPGDHPKGPGRPIAPARSAASSPDPRPPAARGGLGGWTMGKKRYPKSSWLMIDD